MKNMEQLWMIACMRGFDVTNREKIVNEFGLSDEEWKDFKEVDNWWKDTIEKIEAQIKKQK